MSIRGRAAHSDSPRALPVCPLADGHWRPWRPPQRRQHRGRVSGGQAPPRSVFLDRASGRRVRDARACLSATHAHFGHVDVFFSQFERLSTQSSVQSAGFKQLRSPDRPRAPSEPCERRVPYGAPHEGDRTTGPHRRRRTRLTGELELRPARMMRVSSCHVRIEAVGGSAPAQATFRDGGRCDQLPRRSSS